PARAPRARARLRAPADRRARALRLAGTAGVREGDGLGGHEPRPAIDTEDRLPAPRGRMLALVAALRGALGIDHATTLRAMADRRVTTSVIHVVAEHAGRHVGSPDHGHELDPTVLGGFAVGRE